MIFGWEESKFHILKEQSVHSDADVLIHVICDAVLGAADLRDIGFHFPDTDPQYKGIDSKKTTKGSVLIAAQQRIRARQFRYYYMLRIT